ncbi:MAG TPA: MFS transporter, partial [Novosphingobium sp.]|nr:MFS transporter [Novosphingobium sp.]
MAGQVASGDGAPGSGSPGKFAPLKEPTFRRIWTTSLFSNFGQLILGVGAAWEMTRLSDSPQMVALVQTAMMLPLMLVALPAGAVADMFDRRKIALTGLGLSVISASALTAIAFAGLTTPWLLLIFCVLIGAGVALYSPAWQASIGEQVTQDHLPQAIALGTISYNVARSFGPALGGLIVLALGAKAAFAINALFYVPLWLAFFVWKRQHQPSRLPPERIDRAILSGGRYALHSPPIRTVMTRACIFGITSASIMALSPLVARDLLGGDADVYGLLLGASGVGAVLAALFVGDFRSRYSTEAVVRVSTVLTAISLAVIGLSRSVPLTCAAMFVSGGCNILSFAMMNVSVQLSAPRWVTARALSLYSSALTGGFALGAWVWGVVAQEHGVVVAFLGSAVAVLATLLIAWILPLPRTDEEEGNDLVDIGYAPQPSLALTMRSGPVVVEVEYDVDPAAARDFYQVMLRMERVRKRIGAFDWSISRDVANPAIWIERYRCATWGDYLRMRDRYTQTDFEVQEAADAFNRSGTGRRVRRRLERPYGSVRWKSDSP